MIHQSSIINITTKKETTITLIKLILGVLVIFAGNQLVIPIKPVPITLLTISVSLVGLTYSPKLGFLTMATYILAGICGLPMFAGLKSGIMHFMGPSGGYLVGNLIAIPIMGLLKIRLSNMLELKINNDLSKPKSIEYIGDSVYMNTSNEQMIPMTIIQEKSEDLGLINYNWRDIGLICLVGHAMIFLLGVSWLATFIGLKSAIYSGFIVFIPSGLVKIGIFAMAFSYVTNRGSLK